MSRIWLWGHGQSPEYMFLVSGFSDSWGQWLLEAELFDCISHDGTSPGENQKAANNLCSVRSVLTSTIYENLKGLWERHTHTVCDIQVKFSEDYGTSINHSDTECNGLHPLLATFLSDTQIKYRMETNNKMFPWFWNEERVSYLKMSSCLMAASSWHPGQGWPASLCAHSPAYLSFLAVYSVFSVRCQRKCLRIALLFQWVVRSVWAGVTILIPSAESATQSSLAE